MKASNKILTAVIIITSLALAAYNVKAQGKIYKIGDKGPAGGWIFYDKGNKSGGWRYLEAAPEDQGRAKWGCNKISILGAKGTAIGTGKSNTQAIMKSCGEANIAAKLCTNYRGGGKSDWFLPSKDEVNLMDKNLREAGIGSFAADYYWSSSEYDDNHVWYQGFDGGYQSGYVKSVYKKGDDFRVRAIRAF